MKKFTTEYLKEQEKKYQEYQNWYYLNVTKPKRNKKRIRANNIRKPKHTQIDNK